MSSRNETGGMSWFGWAGILALFMILGSGFFFSHRNDMLEWQETGIPVAAKVITKETYTESVRRSQGRRVVTRDETTRKLNLYFNHPIKTDPDSTTAKERVYTSITVSQEVYDQTAEGDEIEIFAQPYDLGKATLSTKSISQSRVENSLENGMSRYMMSMGAAFVLLFGLIYLGMRD